MQCKWQNITLHFTGFPKVKLITEEGFKTKFTDETDFLKADLEKKEILKDLEEIPACYTSDRFPLL